MTQHPDRGTGRERLLAALRRPTSRGQVTAAVLLALVGFAGIAQVQDNQRDDTFAGARQQDLVQLLGGLTQATERAENQIAELEETRRALQDSTDNRQEVLEQARAQAEVLGILAGTLPAGGPGIRMSVADPQGAVGADVMLNGLQELRDAGAEAIEINDRLRVVAHTSLSDGGRGLVVDGQQLAPPYTVEAIGDPHTLAEAMRFTGGFIDEVEEAGGSVSLREVDDLEIRTTRELEAAEHAQPAQ